MTVITEKLERYRDTLLRSLENRGLAEKDIAVLADFYDAACGKNKDCPRTEEQELGIISTDQQKLYQTAFDNNFHGYKFEGHHLVVDPENDHSRISNSPVGRIFKENPLLISSHINMPLPGGYTFLGLVLAEQSRLTPKDVEEKFQAAKDLVLIGANVNATCNTAHDSPIASALKLVPDFNIFNRCDVTDEHLNFIKFLTERNANVSVPNKFGQSVNDIAFAKLDTIKAILPDKPLTEPIIDYVNHMEKLFTALENAGADLGYKKNVSEKDRNRGGFISHFISKVYETLNVPSKFEKDITKLRWEADEALEVTLKRGAADHATNVENLRVHTDFKQFNRDFYLADSMKRQEARLMDWKKLSGHDFCDSFQELRAAYYNNYFLPVAGILKTMERTGDESSAAVAAKTLEKSFQYMSTLFNDRDIEVNQALSAGTPRGYNPQLLGGTRLKHLHNNISDMEQELGTIKVHAQSPEELRAFHKQLNRFSDNLNAFCHMNTALQNSDNATKMLFLDSRMDFGNTPKPFDTIKEGDFAYPQKSFYNSRIENLHSHFSNLIESVDELKTILFDPKNDLESSRVHKLAKMVGKLESIERVFGDIVHEPGEAMLKR